MEAENIQNINNPLVHFETWVSMDDREKEPDENCFMRRQVRFCSQWCLDNLCKYQLYHPIINLYKIFAFNSTIGYELKTYFVFVC